MSKRHLITMITQLPPFFLPSLKIALDMQFKDFIEHKKVNFTAYIHRFKTKKKSSVEFHMMCDFRNRNKKHVFSHHILMWCATEKKNFSLITMMHQPREFLLLARDKNCCTFAVIHENIDIVFLFFMIID